MMKHCDEKEKQMKTYEFIKRQEKGMKLAHGGQWSIKQG